MKVEVRFGSLLALYGCFFSCNLLTLAPTVFLFKRSLLELLMSCKVIPGSVLRSWCLWHFLSSVVVLIEKQDFPMRF